MTREEAIKIIDCYDIGFYDLSGEKIPADKLADAFDMAIEALQTEVVHGEWGHMIADGSDGSHWYEYECSHCGEIVLRPYNFCPNCGTDMGGKA